MWKKEENHHDSGCKAVFYDGFIKIGHAFL